MLNAKLCKNINSRPEDFSLCRFSFADDLVVQIVNILRGARALFLSRRTMQQLISFLIWEVISLLRSSSLSI